MFSLYIGMINMFCDLITFSYANEYIDFADYNLLLDKLHDIELNIRSIFDKD